MTDPVRRPLAAGTLVSHAPDETRSIGCRLATLLEPGDVVVLAGPLGAGKTVLVKGIAEGLGVEEVVVSPTFTLAREYEGRLRLVHVDVYRLDTEQELLDLGLEDLLASDTGDDGVIVVEWGDAVVGLLPADHLEIAIELAEQETTRALAFAPTGPSWGSRAVALAAVLGTG